MKTIEISDAATNTSAFSPPRSASRWTLTAPSTPNLVMSASTEAEKWMEPFRDAMYIRAWHDDPPTVFTAEQATNRWADQMVPAGHDMAVYRHRYADAERQVELAIKWGLMTGEIVRVEGGYKFA
jgi:hypothetical protein